MVNRFITLIFSLFAVVSANVPCPPNEDCVVSCDSLSSCANQTIQCPTSNTSEGYICMISCAGKHLCSSVIIESGSGVSNLIFESLEANASPDVVIFANGTSNVDVVCNGANACQKMQLNVVNAKSVKVSANGTSQGLLSVGVSEATWNIQDSENVEMNFLAYESCFNCTWNLERNTNVALLCGENSACLFNQISITHSSSVAVRAISPPSEFSMRGKASFEQIKSLVIESTDNAIQRESFSLLDIGFFLLNIDDTGSALLCSWDVNNVSHVALNNWEATSIWIANGMDIQNEYQCTNDKDCNIRIDATIETTAQINVACPMKTEDTNVNASGPTCSFYCTSYNGCEAVHLTAVQTPNLQLFFSPVAATGFSLNVDGSGLTEPILNLTCVSSSSCYNSQFTATGYENVTVGCGSNACMDAQFDISNFENANFIAFAYGMLRAFVLLSSGSRVFVASQFEIFSEQAFQNNFWSFTDIGRVHFICAQNYDCEFMTLESIQVGEISVVCGDSILRTAQSCYQVSFVNYVNTSFNLTCAYDESCENVFITYDGDEQYDTSCVVKCSVGPLSGGTNCANTWINVQNNQLGFDAVTLICDDIEDGTTCDNIVIECGYDETTCTCSVEYNETEATWDCEGTCGTSLCEAEKKKKNKNQVVLDVIFGILFFLSVGISIAFFYFCCCYRRFYPRAIKTEERRQLLGNQIGYNT